MPVVLDAGRRVAVGPDRRFSSAAARAVFMAAIIGIGLISSCAAARATDQLDLSTGLKTLLLMAGRISGPATLAVIFDPANPESKADAAAIKNFVDNGSGIPNGLRLTAKLVEFPASADLSGARVAFLAKGLPAGDFARVARAAAAAGTLTISTDLACAEANACVLGVVSKPQVQIYYSAAAANAARIVFTPAFIMLVRQVGAQGDSP